MAKSSSILYYFFVFCRKDDYFALVSSGENDSVDLLATVSILYEQMNQSYEIK